MFESIYLTEKVREEYSEKDPIGLQRIANRIRELYLPPITTTISSIYYVPFVNWIHNDISNNEAEIKLEKLFTILLAHQRKLDKGMMGRTFYDKYYKGNNKSQQLSWINDNAKWLKITIYEQHKALIEKLRQRYREINNYLPKTLPQHYHVKQYGFRDERSLKSLINPSLLWQYWKLIKKFKVNPYDGINYSIEDLLLKNWSWENGEYRTFKNDIGRFLNQIADIRKFLLKLREAFAIICEYAIHKREINIGQLTHIKGEILKVEKELCGVAQYVDGLSELRRFVRQNQTHKTWILDLQTDTRWLKETNNRIHILPGYRSEVVKFAEKKDTDAYDMARGVLFKLKRECEKLKR